MMQKRISTKVGVSIIIAVAIVLFGGALAYSRYANSQFPISNQSPNSSSQNEIAGWKTYRNNEYGFEFKHLPDDIVDTTKYGFCSNADICLNIGSISKPLSFTLTGTMGGSLSLLYGAPKGTTATKDMINGYPVVKWEQDLPYYYQIDYFIQNTNTNEIWDISAVESKFPDETIEQYREKIKNINTYLNQILSTFKFTK